MRNRLRKLKALIAAWLAGTCGVTFAQIVFVDANASVGLTHVNTYGQTFDFSDIRPPFTPSMGATMQRNMGNGAAVGDYDRDGDLDLYLLNQKGIANGLWRNDVAPEAIGFSQETSGSVVGDTGFGRVAFFADLDNDGWQDLLLVNDDRDGADYPPCRIYRNDHGRFADVSDGSGFAPPGVIKGGACLGDYDNDGLLDVYVTLWLFYGTDGPSVWEGYNRLYRNLGGFRFQDVTLDVGLGLLGRDSFSCAFADFDNDGDGDLYVAVDHSSDVYYRNDDGVFVDQTVAVGATHKGNDMGIAVADFDHDGDLDVYSTNITDPGTSSPIYGTGKFNTLLVNQIVETGTLAFVDEAAARGASDTAWGWGAEWFDADNDGDLDLYAVNGFEQWIKGTNPFHPLLHTPAVLLENDGTGHYTPTVSCGAEIVYDSRGAIAFDYDADGDNDLLISNVNQPTILLENRTSGAGHWLGVRLFGGCGVNVDAVGARVIAQVAATTYTHEVIAGGSYLSGRSLEAHFGLGNPAVVDVLTIHWPDGKDTVLKDLPSDRMVTIHKTPGDYDFSGTIDLRDFAAYQRCLASASVVISPLCEALDLDQSGSLDRDDYHGWRQLLDGPAVSVCTP